MAHATVTANMPGSLPTTSDLLDGDNRATFTLNGALDDSTTTIDVNESVSSMPTTGVITVNDERIKYTGTDTDNDTFTGATRGFDGSSAAAHSDGDTVRANITAYNINSLNAELIAVATEIGATGSQNFVRTDGTEALTANWGVGGFDITNIGKAQGDTLEVINAGMGSNPTLTANAAGDQTDLSGDLSLGGTNLFLTQSTADYTVTWADPSSARTLTINDPGANDDFVFRTDTATLTNKTIDADNNTISNLAHGSEVNNPSSGVHGVTGSVVGTTDTQTLTNKTVDLGNNTLTGTAAEFNTAVSDDTLALVSDDLSVFAATTSAQLAGVISDETGSGALVFGTSPSLGTPTLTQQTAVTDITLQQTTADYTLTWDDPAAGRAISIPDPGGTDVFVFEGATQTLSAKTLSGSTLSGTTTYTNAGAGTDPTLASNDTGQVLTLTGDFHADNLSLDGGTTTIDSTELNLLDGKSNALADVTGTPSNNEVATFTDADTLQGESNLTFDGTILTTTSGGQTTLVLETTEAASSDGPTVQFQESGNFTYQANYSTANDKFEFTSADTDGGGTTANIWEVADGSATFVLPNGGADLAGRLNFTASSNIQDAGTDAIQFDGSQNVTIPNGTFTAQNGAVFNEDGGDNDFRVEGDTNANLVTVDASADVVGIGAAPNTGFLADYELQVGTDDSDGAGTDSFGVLIRANGQGTSKLSFADGQSADGRGRVWYDHANDSLDLYTAETEQVTISSSGQFSAKFPNTSAGTGLVVATNDASLQEIQRDSSTLRHKDNVQPITSATVDPADVLAINPIHYTRDGKPEVGFGAEHFAGIGLDDGMAWVDDEVTGFLAGSRVIDAAQHVVLQDHEARLQALEQAA